MFNYRVVEVSDKVSWRNINFSYSKFGGSTQSNQCSTAGEYTS